MTYLVQALSFSAIEKSFPQFVTVSHFVGVTFMPFRIRMYCSVIPTVVCPYGSRASRMLPVDASLSVAVFARQSRI